MAAVCIAGDSEWAMGSPTTANNLAALEEPFDGIVDQQLELVVGAAVVVELAAKGILDLGLVGAPAGVVPEQVRLALATQRLDAVYVVRAHAEDEVGVLDDGARQEGGSVDGEIEALLESDEVRALGGRRA